MRKPRVLSLKTGGINHVLEERMGGLNKSFRKYAEQTGEGNSKKVDFIFRNHYQQNVAEMWHSEC